jgi:hypothetical protein
MKTVKLSSPRDLERFLRILAEESVTAAKMGSSDSLEKNRQKALVRQIRKDKAELSEEDEEATSPAPAAEKAPASVKPDVAASEPAPQKVPAPTPRSPSAADINPSIDSVIDAIKEIRGGKGAGDSAVESELIAYFDRLEDAEKTALVVMLRSLGGIMRLQMTGADAPEPADYEIFTTSKPGEKSKSSEVKPDTTKEPAPVTPGSEDTAPPIKVGSPVSEAYRARIRDLLARNN